MKKTALGIFGLLICVASFATVRLPVIFGDNMVLQRGRPIPVWGWGKAGEKIAVKFHLQTKTTKADKSGKWMVTLDTEIAGGPYDLDVTGNNTIHLTNVLVGEVWICSGQSNMEMPIAGWGKIANYQQEIAEAQYPAIRQIKIPLTVNFVPQDDISAGTWKVCSPETAGDFTSVGYFFARELYTRLHVPIGLINSSWGGTMVETWISRGKLENNIEFKSIVASMNPENQLTIAKQRKETLDRKILSMQGPVEKDIDVRTWKDLGLDDSHWGHMSLPGLWEERGLEDLDGLVWFRRSIELAAEDAGKPAILSLGKIDDSDESYLNGTKVGETKNQYSEQRKYRIPAGVLKAGKNVIAVRVEDTGGGGGLYGEAGDMSLSVGTKSVPLAGDWSFKIEKVAETNMTLGPNSNPTLLFNAMINPLVPFSIKGAIWYQGEANAGRAYQYRESFPMMITDWRQHWHQGDFPFYFVQLSSFNSANGDSRSGSTWAELREAQTMTLSLPNTGMAVTTDIGDAKDIHPKNKQDVGKRLAAIALHNLYESANEYSGPMYTALRKEGSKILLSFSHVGKGLAAKDKYGYLKGFELAGADRVFHFAKAYISGNQVVVSSDDVPDPIAVHYGWADDAGEANLFNGDGFPASPFRTDDWTGITASNKYKLGE